MLEMIRPAGLATAGRGDAKKVGRFGSHSFNSQTNRPVQAYLTGSDLCIAAGVTARAVSPVLAKCRKLVEAGFDPNRSLHAYRGRHPMPRDPFDR